MSANMREKHFASSVTIFKAGAFLIHYATTLLGALVCSQSNYTETALIWVIV